VNRSESKQGDEKRVGEGVLNFKDEEKEKG
jgi:hypothetical protein